ncbi:uncharacterized protein LOC110848138 [Folsomia candida]|uniref:uncharacterized protein LOC110848138 n=1 Tax=Folsomia candida TaxID=158441 RepID=UPI000B907ABE|nr:uncharacterized protein LOC110848138 [Folsomia candida]
MSLRRLGRLTRIGTKAGLAGGTIYLYYETGLWKGSDETIQNYEKFKKDVKLLYESTPSDVQKWAEYGKSSLTENIAPYKKSIADFREQYLSFDLSFLTEEGDGVLKPTWNKGVSWTFESLPGTLKGWGSSGWKMVSDLATDKTAATGVTATATSPAQKQ